MIEVKILKRKRGGGAAGSSAAGGGISYSGDWNGSTSLAKKAEEAEHAAKADEAEEAKHAASADEAAKAEEAEHARKAAELDADSPTREDFLSATSDDAAAGVITFLKGLKLGDGKHSLGADGRAVLGALESAGISNTGNLRNSEKITTKDLMVLGTAHFFKVLIDEIRSAGGSLLLTAADGFTVDYLTTDTDAKTATLYWRRKDAEGRERENKWMAGDQALCHTMNATEAKHWWAYVLEAGTADHMDALRGEKMACNYIRVSTDTESMLESPAEEDDGSVGKTAYYLAEGDTGAISVGDEVSMLGHRTSDADKNEDGTYDFTGARKRGGAIYIAAYESIDAGLEAPLMAQYAGVDDFALSSHRTTYFSFGANGRANNAIVGDLRVSGQDGTARKVLEWMGEWSEKGEYWAGCEVSHGGSTWVAMDLADGEKTTEEPSEGAAHWKKVVSKGEQGEKGGTGYRIELFTSAGADYYMEGMDYDATLELHVWLDEEEITAELPETRIIWSRTSEAGDADDEQWNARHAETGTSLHLTGDDLSGMTCITVELLDESGKTTVAAKRIKV